LRGSLLVLAVVGLAGFLACRFMSAPVAPVATRAPETHEAPRDPVYQLVGVGGEACVTTIRAALERLPGVAAVHVEPLTASITMKPGMDPLPCQQVLAAIRATGHGAVAPDGVATPGSGSLTADEAAKLDYVRNEWLVLREEKPLCAGCSAAFLARIRQTKGVREVSVRPGSKTIYVRRYADYCSVSQLTELARSSTTSPVSITPLRSLLVKIVGMRCHKCVLAIEATLRRSKTVLHSEVREGEASVIVDLARDAQPILEAIDGTPGPICQAPRYGAMNATAYRAHPFTSSLLKVPGE